MPYRHARWDALRSSNAARYTNVFFTSLCGLVLGISVTGDMPPAEAADSTAEQAAAQEDTVSFSIPAQPLVDALPLFSEQAGIQFSYQADEVQGLRSNALEGSYAPSEGLSRLLEGSGVRYSLLGETAVLQPPAKPAPQDTGPAASGAGERELGPVVVSATRTQEPVSSLTRSVTVVDEKQVEQQKRIDRSLGEILGKSVPGFSPSTEGLTNFGQTLRGRNFLTLIDGIPQSTPLRDGRRALNTIDADVIERIEVVRGGTAVYGFGAAGGLVNIITREPEEGPINGHSEGGVKISTEHVEDSLEWHTNHRVSGTLDNFDYVLSGSFVERNGFFDAEGDRIPADPFGVQGGFADTEEYNLFGKAGLDFDGGQQRIEATVNHFNIFQDSAWAGYGVGDPEEGEKTPAVRGNPNAKDPGTRNTTVNLEYSNKDVLGSDVELQAYYGDLLARFAKFPGFDQAQVESEKFGSRLTIDTPIEFEPMPFTLTWGVDYLHDKTGQPAVDGPTTTPWMEQDAIAGFAQLEVPVDDWGLVRAGVRHERIWVDVDDVTNRMGVDVEGGQLKFDETLFNASGVLYLSDTVEAFGGFSQGFSLADIGRAITDTTETEATALQSEAQTVNNYEIGLRATEQAWDASITAFYSESDNGTTFNPDLEIAKQPEEIYGLELAASVRPVEKLEFGGSFTWLEGKVDLDDDGSFEEDLPSTRIPPVKVTGYVEYQPIDWWTARLQGLYSGNRTPDSTQFGGGEVDDFVIFDLYSSFDTGYGEVAVGVENLLNEDYFTVLSQAGALSYAYSKGPGRTVSLTYSVNW